MDADLRSCTGDPASCLCFKCWPDFESEYEGACLAASEDAELDAMHVGESVAAVLDMLGARSAARDEAVALLAFLRSQGCIFFIEHGTLRAEPIDLVPDEFRERIFQLPLRQLLEELVDA